MADKQSSMELATWIGQLLDKKGGREITILDLRERSSITDFFVMTTATSSRQMETLLETPCQELKKLGFPPYCIEGKGTHWMVADFGDVILHVFDEKTRKYFNLEELWEAAPRIDWQRKHQAASSL